MAANVGIEDDDHSSFKTRASAVKIHDQAAEPNLAPTANRLKLFKAAGTFSQSALLPFWRAKSSQDSPIANVLHLEAPKTGIMAEKVNIDTADRAGEPVWQTDEQLMLAFTRGSTEAFTALFLRYKQPLYGFFRRRVGVGSLAEELTQETFIAVLHSTGRYQMTALFRTYLYAVAYRLLRSYRRKAFFRAGFSASKTPSHEPAVNPSLETDLLMREALGKLDRVEREIILLREFEQLSYLEIAMLLHIPVNTVRSRLFRARSTLRVMLMDSTRRTGATNLSMTKEQA